MAAEIRNVLQECGLKQSDLLTIQIVDELSHPLGNCLGYYDCEYDEIRIMSPSKWHSLMDEHDAYSLLPVEVTLRALLTHELAHAFVFQSAGDREVPLVDQEYIAAAMELNLMDAAWREVFLKTTSVRPSPSEDLINLWIYAFAPRKFAANAWQHFSLPENGCSFIEKLLEGEKSFGATASHVLR